MALSTSNTKYDYKEKHIDSNVSESSFTSAARCVVYAAQSLGSTVSDTTSEFKPIGVLQGYNWQEQRQIEMIFEIGSELPYLIPGRTTGQISLSRMLIYGADLTNVLYGVDAATDQSLWIRSLKDISKPFHLLFTAFSNQNAANTDSAIQYSRVFRNCWIQARSESLNAGQIIIAEQLNVMYQDVPTVTITTK